IRGNPDLDDTIARLHAYEKAGADVLYAPGLRTAEEIRSVCDAVSRPVNVLAVPGLTVADAVAAGAQRPSGGGAPACVAVSALAQAAAAVGAAGDSSVLAARVRLSDWCARRAVGPVHRSNEQPQSSTGWWVDSRRMGLALEGDADRHRERSNGA